TRLIDMGVEPFLIASSLQGVVAQRLVRRLCPACKEAFTPDSSLLNQFGKTPKDAEGITFYKAVGCEACRNRGYAGRVAVSELLMMNDDLQRAILNRESSITIKKMARNKMHTMREEGWEKICKGVASFDDVLRTTQLDSFED
ncbi:MAG TPA: type II secretion system protein GspE, partial [Candidatus Sumerlaeota bacterium]|nr:type II secretion system protein GspE [Candidatus Sumerlaeota bacterium]